MTDDEALVEALSDDYRKAALGPADRAMLDFARKLTLTPASVGRADIEVLREAGFDDRAVHDICNVAAYYAYVNRIADGLGVELESYWEQD